MASYLLPKEHLGIIRNGFDKFQLKELRGQLKFIGIGLPHDPVTHARQKEESRFGIQRTHSQFHELNINPQHYDIR